MKAVALILSLAVLTGCSARVVQQVDTSVSKWEETVDHFWQHFVKLSDMAYGDVQTPDFGTKLDTSIAASTYQLTTYIDSVSEGQLSSDREWQRLAARLQEDMLNAKEHGIQSRSQQIQSMGQKDFHTVQEDIRAFTNGLRTLLDRDIQDIRKYLSEHQISQNQDTVEPIVQQTGDTTSQRQAGGLGLQWESQGGALGQQRRNQDEVPGQQQWNQDEVPGQQRRNQDEVPGQQQWNQDEVPGQQRRNQDEVPGQQQWNQDEVPGQQQWNQGEVPGQQHRNPSLIWDRGQEHETQGTVLVSTVQ